jgi:hypothetical protein
VFGNKQEISGMELKNQMTVETAEKGNLKKLFAGTKFSDETNRNIQGKPLKECSIQTGNGA